MNRKIIQIALFIFVFISNTMAGNLSSIILQSSHCILGTIVSSDSTSWNFQIDSCIINSTTEKNIYLNKSIENLQCIQQKENGLNTKIIVFLPNYQSFYYNGKFKYSNNKYNYYLDAFIVVDNFVLYEGVKYSLTEFMTSIALYKEQNQELCNTFLQGGENSKLKDAFTANSKLRNVLFQETKERCFDENSSNVNTSAIISNSNMNILYAMIENPLAMAIPNKKNSDFYAKISEGELYVENGSYVAKVNFPGKIYITLYDSKTNDSITSKYFYVRNIPLPHAFIVGFSGGEILKELLLAANTIIVKYDDYGNDSEFNSISFTLQSYTVTIQDIKYNVLGNTITDEVKDAIQKLESGNKIYFDNLVVRFSNGIEKTLEPTLFKIK